MSEHDEQFDLQEKLTDSIMMSVQLTKAIELLAKARMEVGVRLSQEINQFLKGTKELEE